MKKNQGTAAQRMRAKGNGSGFIMGVNRGSKFSYKAWG